MSAPAAASRIPVLDQQVDVETPEQIVFSYTVAGVGSRAAAAIIDLLICVGAFFGIVLITWLAARALRTSPWAGVSGGWMSAIVVVAQFAVIWGYYVLFEGLRDGQTPGKRQLGLRVVQDGGYSVSLAASAMRNIVRVIDMQPALTYGVGIVSAVATKSGKRLGDLAAGTIVVHERVLHAPLASVVSIATAPLSSAAARPVALLDDDEFALLERFMARRQSLEAAQRARLVEGIAARFRDRVPELDGATDASALVSLFERERSARARGAASRSDTGARREQHAIVAQGTERWSAFAAQLAAARARGLERMSEAEVSEFVARYRELSADLARLRTATRGRPSDALFHLSRLVAGGHNLFYGQRRPGTAGAWRFIVVSVPREIRRSWRPIGLAALLLFGPMLASYVSVRQRPERAADFMPPGMLDRARTGAERERRGGSYLESESAGAAMASRITTNNIQVTYVAFAAGMTAGLGTVLALVFNGVQIGGALALFVNEGVGHLIFGFIAAHGVFELFAICLAGGSGFLIAGGMLLPGARTRSEALVVEGRRAVRLIAGATFLLLWAGLIEGNISPSALPDEAKYFVSAVTALLLLLYVTRGRRDEDEGPAELHGYRDAISR